MHRMMMGLRQDRNGFWGRVADAIRSGELDQDDIAVIGAALAVCSAIGGFLGWVVMEWITAHNAAVMGAL